MAAPLQQPMGEALHSAIAAKNAPECLRLVAAGADVSFRNAGGVEALGASCSAGLSDVALAILARVPGVSVDAAGADSCTALIRASKKGLAQAIDALLERGARIDAADARGWTPLYWACANAHEAAALRLVEAGVGDVNAADGDGCTALMLASIAGLAPVVAALLARGAQINAFNRKGHTALFLACFNAREATALQLLAAGADANGSADSPLSCMDDGRMPAVKAALLAAGARRKPPPVAPGNACPCACAVQ